MALQKADGTARRHRKRLLFHLVGAGIVASWLVMLGVLITRVHFKDLPSSRDHEGQGTPVGIESSQREWREIFLKDRKVGYSVNLIKPFKKGYFIQEEIFLRMNLMGLGSSLHTVTQCRVDERFFLESFTFTMGSGVVGFHVSGKVEGEALVVESGRGKERRTQTIRITKAPMIGIGLAHFFKSRNLTVGESFRFPIFDPSTMAQKEIPIRVAAREPLTLNRISYQAFRLEAEMWGKAVTFWIGEDGSVLKEEGFMGLTTVKSSAARAPEDMDAGGGTDLYELTAVRPDRPLPDPARLSALKVEISGLDHAALDQGILNGGRQRYGDGILEIKKEALPSEPGFRIPYEDGSGRMRDFLKPEFNIESDEKEILHTARQISGKDVNPFSVARKLLEWVYRNIEKKPVLSVPSALEVLRTRVGDCNEHAILLTALLRAVGIPARVSIGLTYSRDRFFYHAWTEAYLGAWISMDATVNQMPADPAHIKLIEGNLEKQVEIAGLVGEMKLKVLDFHYD
ncbi:MAG: transglutaminase domain-containing protein [Deltaproteobacteria bacterium]|nr:transglutaminase domain-containing protein [Deltaproteobacteria bacterium]